MADLPFAVGDAMKIISLSGLVPSSSLSSALTF
jgi:hypothetical protein